jgi:hypothetical protein
VRVVRNLSTALRVTQGRCNQACADPPAAHCQNLSDNQIDSRKEHNPCACTRQSTSAKSLTLGVERVSRVVGLPMTQP